LPANQGEKMLIKMHGDFDEGNIVLTENDYFDYSRNFPLIRYCNFDDSVFLVFKNAVGFLYLTEWEGMGDEWCGVYLSFCYESQHLFTGATIFSQMMMRLGCGILFF